MRLDRRGAGRLGAQELRMGLLLGLGSQGPKVRSRRRCVSLGSTKDEKRRKGRWVAFFVSQIAKWVVAKLHVIRYAASS